jgi:hypothetical protein
LLSGALQTAANARNNLAYFGVGGSNALARSNSTAHN